LRKYDKDSKNGIIGGSDDKRYPFNMSDWMGDGSPVSGGEVDFIPKEGNATEILPIARPGVLIRERSKPTTTLLGLFFGGIGAHKFYMGNWGWGILYVVFCWTFIPVIVALVEISRYIVLKDDEFAEKARKAQTDGPFGFVW